MALNKKLLRKVRNRIAKIPESYDQGQWVSESDRSPCGTAACLAGEAIIVAAPSIQEGIKSLNLAVRQYGRASRSDVGVVKKARTLLGITLDESDAMFDSFGDGWPEPYRTRFQRLKTNKAKAKVAVAYLDECLKRGKVTW
jgi:hypothetical protein